MMREVEVAWDICEEVTDWLNIDLITEHSERCEEIPDSQIPSVADPDDNCDDHTHSEILNL